MICVFLFPFLGEMRLCIQNCFVLFVVYLLNGKNHSVSLFSAKVFSLFSLFICSTNIDYPPCSGHCSRLWRYCNEWYREILSPRTDLSVGETGSQQIYNNMLDEEKCFGEKADQGRWRVVGEGGI